ncbi:MAG TPA: double zinc ribbon domain-containing protein [Gemmatimonadaceae bacterium]|nr:double zinc ribbon domain-containing protein [Gemmatimonadaceae bacterium]
MGGRPPLTAVCTVAKPLVDLLFPRACAVCERLLDRAECGVVCGRCWARLPLLPWPQCARCGHPTYGHACRWCELLPPYVRAARSVAWASGAIGLGVVHALKYQGWHRVAGEMAARMARLPWPVDVIDERCAVVPVPLSAKRARERGYNQSERLAHALAAQWQIPVWSDVLSRTRHTETQTRLTPGDRLRNVSGAFRARSSARNLLRGAHVILVDDVVTTAATLNACAAALCDGGARIISFVTFGRAPALGDRW